MHVPQNTFKRALLAGQQQYGFWLGLCSPLAAELCAHTGYDWLLVDGEHAPNDLNSVIAQLHAVAASPVHPVVRLVEGNQARIKQYLDAGAQTLLVPMVETAAQAHYLVQAMAYPPRGVRGVGTALARAAAWNMRRDYFREAEVELCLIVQIETVLGLKNLDDILAVDGVDAVFIGPADLAASMGHLGNPGHPEVVAAVSQAIRSVRAAGKPAGTLATNRDMAWYYEEQGVQFVALGVDTVALASAALSILTNHRSEGERPSAGNGAY